MSKWVVVAALCSGLAVACGGGTGSGVSGSKSLVSLNDGEINDLCKYIVDVSGPTRTVDCGGGVKVTLEAQTVAECVADLKASQAAAPTCAATVDHAEACVEALADFTDAQLCADTPLPTACAPLLECGGIM